MPNGHPLSSATHGHRDFLHWFNAQFPIGYGNTPLKQLPCLLSLAGFIRVRVNFTEAHDVYVLRFGCGAEWTLSKVGDHLFGIFSRLGRAAAEGDGASAGPAAIDGIRVSSALGW